MTSIDRIERALADWSEELADARLAVIVEDPEYFNDLSHDLPRLAALRKAVAALDNIATGGGPADVGADDALAAIADLLENGGQ
jgi:hypothetical protein